MSGNAVTDSENFFALLKLQKLTFQFADICIAHKMQLQKVLNFSNVCYYLIPLFYLNGDPRNVSQEIPHS